MLIKLFDADTKNKVMTAFNICTNNKLRFLENYNGFCLLPLNEHYSPALFILNKQLAYVGRQVVYYGA